MSELACKSCHLVANSNRCPECKTMSMSDDWIGISIIIDPEMSQIAKELGVKKPGRYAVRVR